jgi:hypothetical protein
MDIRELIEGKSFDQWYKNACYDTNDELLRLRMLECWQASAQVKDKEWETKMWRLRYFTFAHALHYFEQKTGEKREAIKKVRSVSDFGYVLCEVITASNTHYISDEMEAGFLLDWAETQGKICI